MREDILHHRACSERSKSWHILQTNNFFIEQFNTCIQPETDRRLVAFGPGAAKLPSVPEPNNLTERSLGAATLSSFLKRAEEKGKAMASVDGLYPSRWPPTLKEKGKEGERDEITGLRRGAALFSQTKPL